MSRLFMTLFLMGLVIATVRLAPRFAWPFQNYKPRAGWAVVDDYIIFGMEDWDYAVVAIDNLPPEPEPIPFGVDAGSGSLMRAGKHLFRVVGHNRRAAAGERPMFGFVATVESGETYRIASGPTLPRLVIFSDKPHHGPKGVPASSQALKN